MPSNNPIEGWGTVSGAAAYAGVTPRTVREWIKRGLVHCRLSRKLILINFKDLDAFLRDFEIQPLKEEKEIRIIVDDVLRKFR